jgi:hypothetical protein
MFVVAWKQRQGEEKQSTYITIKFYPINLLPSENSNRDVFFYKNKPFRVIYIPTVNVYVCMRCPLNTEPLQPWHCR